ncbi:ABC transporter permease subunit [Actinokineospora soli]|uniref:ABC transporter permease subunit n=1 Tax=Actinokineospora soli TaxID=1048753 RepID=A0ABW2TVF4_9PSEU
MLWLTWRQFRPHAVSVFGLAAVFAAVFAATGPSLDELANVLDDLGPFQRQLYLVGMVAVYVVPGVTGVFWGAPLITRELEAGTHRLVWNQTVGRTRWLVVKLGVLGLAAMAAAGAFSLAVTWWAAPIDAAAALAADGEFASRVDPLVFSARGVAPIGYAAFGFTLGVAVGALLRRTVAAMAVTSAVYIAVMMATPDLLRAHVIAPVQETVTITPTNLVQIRADRDGTVLDIGVAAPAGSWLLANQTVDATGAATAPPAQLSGCIPPPGPERAPDARLERCFADITAQGYRQVLTYQPVTRFWPLQWIETGVFLVLSALLTWLAVARVRRLS